MSADSEDGELSKLERAAAFMREVRLAQAGRAARLRGNNYLTPERQQAVTNALENSALVAAVKASAHVDLPMNYLAERFEEMCRRQGAMVDAELRPSVVKLLAAELWVNHTALGVPAEKLLSATLHHGAIAPELLKEFPDLPRYAITHAMRHAPEAPRDLLTRASKEIATLMSEPEFQNLADMVPSAIEQASIFWRSNARSVLQRVAATKFGQHAGEEKDWKR